jgi:hypothetical protein
MRVRVLITLLASLALLFVMLPAAQADQVQLYFTGTTSGGIYDPYEFKITPVGKSSNPNPTNGTIVWLNCDDFSDHIWAGESWVVNVIDGGGNNLASTQMSQLANGGVGWSETQAQIAYDEKAWVETYYSAANNPVYSNAIWAIFQPWAVAPNALNDLAACAVTGKDTHGVATTCTAAQQNSQGDSVNNYLTWRQHDTIYSPDRNCKVGGACGDATTGWYNGDRPQEFNAVPDGGVTLMLLGGALVGLETLRRRFRA